MSELIIELFSEEIPARLQRRGADMLERALNDRLIGAGFMPEGVKAFAGPRRLTVVATGLPTAQPDRREEKKGPRVGAPDKAVAGFLKSAGLSSVDECEQREDKKGSYYVAITDQKGRATTSLISEFIPEIVAGFSWPKSMRWGARDLRWVRPLHRVLCVFDHEIVPVEIDGVNAGDVTEGHRFLAPGQLSARNFQDYVTKLRGAKVILDAQERKEIIAADADTLCRAQGLELVSDANLLDEVTGLAEWPVAMMGSFDEKFLTVPDEVLTASMRGHQKYFSVYNPNTERLANKFICVANIEAPDGGAAMRQGYERVLEARLSDAWFLYRQDLKISLEDRLPMLQQVTFFDKLGSVGDKAQRISTLARDIASRIGGDPEKAARAGLLAKADLVSAMVNEFPELQGLMGRYYALEQGEDHEIADAVRDHYKPAGQDDAIPTASTTVAVALADKIDTLTAFWSIDQKPTGSKDPFALRRAALGVIALVLHSDIRIDLESDLVGLALTHLGITGGNDRTLLTDELMVFFHDRLKVYFRDHNFRHDHINAALITHNFQSDCDYVRVRAKLVALSTFLKTDDGANLAAAYKRAANILKAEEKKDKAAASSAVSDHLLQGDEEKALNKAIATARTTAAKAMLSEDFEAAMHALSVLRAPLDVFFENVTVNADDKDLRANRLALLVLVVDAISSVADFSKLEG